MNIEAIETLLEPLGEAPHECAAHAPANLDEAIALLTGARRRPQPPQCAGRHAAPRLSPR